MASAEVVGGPKEDEGSPLVKGGWWNDKLTSSAVLTPFPLIVSLSLSLLISPCSDACVLGSFAQSASLIEVGLRALSFPSPRPFFPSVFRCEPAARGFGGRWGGRGMVEQEVSPPFIVVLQVMDDIEREGDGLESRRKRERGKVKESRRVRAEGWMGMPNWVGVWSDDESVRSAFRPHHFDFNQGSQRIGFQISARKAMR